MPVRASVTKADVKRVETTPAPALAYDPEEVVEAEAEHVLEQEYSPKDKIPAGEVVYVRNNTGQVVRFVDSYKTADTKFNILFAPAGHDDSIVSLEENLAVLRNPGFQRWWKAGKLTVTSDSQIQPLVWDDSKIEIERLQQFSANGVHPRTAPGSLPLSANLDLSFLEEQDPSSPKYKG